MEHKIVLVDDDFLLLLSLEELLVSTGYNVVGTANTGEEGLAVCRAEQPSLVFMDIKLPGELDGIEVAEILLKEQNIPVIFLSGYDDVDLVERAKRIKPLSFLLKPLNDRQVLAALRVALFKVEAQREHLFLSGEAFPDELPPRYANLTPTEIRIISLVRKGKSSKDVAESLGISVQTVLWHRKNIRKKLNLINSNENLTINLLM